MNVVSQDTLSLREPNALDLSDAGTTAGVPGTSDLSTEAETPRKQHKPICYRLNCNDPGCRMDHFCDCPDMDSEYSHMESDHNG